MKITWLGHAALRIEGSRTVSLIRQSPEQFKKLAGAASEVTILPPGGAIEI